MCEHCKNTGVVIARRNNGLLLSDCERLFFFRCTQCTYGHREINLHPWSDEIRILYRAKHAIQSQAV